MEAGKLRHKINVKRETTTGTGDRGQPVTDLTTVATVWGRIEELSGSEAETARQLVSTATTKITLRYINGLKTSDTIEFNGRSFEIGHIANPDNRNRELTLTCSEVQ